MGRAEIDDVVYAYFRDLGLDAEGAKEQLAARERELAEARDILKGAEQATQAVKGALGARQERLPI